MCSLISRVPFDSERASYNVQLKQACCGSTVWRYQSHHSAGATQSALCEGAQPPSWNLIFFSRSLQELECQGWSMKLLPPDLPQLTMKGQWTNGG